MDGKPSHYFFVIATPTESGDAHLKVLSSLSGELAKANTQESLKNVTDFNSLLEVFAHTSKKEDLGQITTKKYCSSHSLCYRYCSYLHGG